MRTFDYETVREDLLTPDIANTLAALHEHKIRQPSFLDQPLHLLEISQLSAKFEGIGASNRLEAVYLEDGRLLSLVKSPKARPRNHTEKEILGYRNALNTIHQTYEQLVPSSDVILQLHRILYSYLPKVLVGQYKNSDMSVQIDSARLYGVRFQHLSAQATPPAMENLCHTYLQALDKGKMDPLVLIAMFLLDFLCIQPFHNGTGRMSRLMAHLLLCRAGYFVGTYVSLETVIEKSMISYYNVLTQSTQGWYENQHSYRPFVKYYLAVLLHGYKRFEKILDHSHLRKVKPLEQIRQVFAGRPDAITKAELCELLPDINLTIVERTLAALIKESYIHKTGYGRTATYVRIQEE